MGECRTIDILGQNYVVKLENTRTDTVLKNCDGECRWYKKEIVIDNELEEPHRQHVIKHEIIHAFFAESGLQKYREDELIVDWIAWNIDKIQDVIKKAQGEV